MGYQVKLTPTGVEIEVHVFDDFPQAESYVTRARRYVHQKVVRITGSPVGRPGDVTVYSGGAGLKASIQQVKSVESGSWVWQASFWEEEVKS